MNKGNHECYKAARFLAKQEAQKIYFSLVERVALRDLKTAHSIENTKRTEKRNAIVAFI